MPDAIETQADIEPVSLQSLSIEELEAQMAKMEGNTTASEDPDETPEPDEEQEEETPTESDQAQPEYAFTLGDEAFTADQLAEMIPKAKDYTKKTQELAAQRKEVEQLKQVTDTWNSQPEMRPVILQHMAQQLTPEQRAQIGLGVSSPSTQTADPDIDLDELTDNEQAIYLKGQREIATLKAQLSEVSPLLGQLKQMVEQQAQEKTISLAAQQAANALNMELGVTGITPESVAAAMKETGLQDAEAAWLKVNRKSLLTAGVKQGVQQAVVNKPNAPGKSGTRTFDPYATDADGKFLYTGDEAARMIAKGWTPKG